MWAEIYGLFIDELCRVLGIPDPESMYGVANLNIKGTTFSLVYGGDIVPGAFHVFADFGALPEEQRELVLCRLLELNMFLFSRKSIAFTYEAQSGHIVLKSCLPLESTTVPDLVSFLADLADMAEGCRKGGFLTEKEKQAGTLFSAKAVAASSKGTASRLQARFGSRAVPGAGI